MVSKSLYVDVTIRIFETGWRNHTIGIIDF